MNPFENRIQALSGPATDALPVIPDDVTDLPHVAIGLYIVSIRRGTRSSCVDSFLPELPVPWEQFGQA